MPGLYHKNGGYNISGYDEATDKLVVGTARERLFWNGSEFNTVDEWEILQSSTGGGGTLIPGFTSTAMDNGMTITGPLGGAVSGSNPYLSISSGTTANAVTAILSKTVFMMPFEIRYQISASQRIANNSFRIGFVEIGNDGNILASTDITTAPAVLNARNAAMAQWSGTVATTGDIITRASGSAIETLAAAYGTGFTTVATGTSPNFIAAAAFSISVERDKVLGRAYTLNSLANAGLTFGIDRVLPSPTKRYKLAIIVENGSTAPVSSTDWRIHLVNLLDTTRFDVSPRNAGTGDLSKAFPVNVVGGTVTTSAPSGGLPITDTSTLGFAEGTSILAANAVYTGTSRDLGTTLSSGGVRYSDFTAFVLSETAGTLRLENSTDNTNWRRASVDTAVAANTPVYLTVPVVTRYSRMVFTNGATAQTVAPVCHTRYSS